MTSVTLPRRAHNLHSISENQNNQFCQTDDEETNNRIDNNYQHSNKRLTKKSTSAVSLHEPGTQSTSPSNNRLRHLCSRVKRRLTLTKEDRTRSEDMHQSVSERRMIRFRDYESFSSSGDDPFQDIEWPDFEKVYDSIPACLINALPGLDDFSIEENNDDVFDLLHYDSDETDEYSTEQMNLFVNCKRGKYFRRNAFCQKLDKSQYNEQLSKFIQQLMIEKLMRTWT